ncbi:MAG: FkbM family methyltransferase [Phycisphaerales bacterium]
MNPRQVQLCMVDVFALLAEVLADERSLPIIDGGANRGDTGAAIRRLFPEAPVHMFEPVCAAYTELATRFADDPLAYTHQLALGERGERAEIHINRNLWTCSLLPANERGMGFHGDWCETVRTESIEVVRLDDWSAAHGIDELGIVKLDLQGFELAALRGMGSLLPRTRAVYAEAQITPEYAGASTLSEIDLFMRSQGFGLYQITDLCLKGPHAEPSCCDGLWLRNDVLARVRALPCPQAIMRSVDLRSARMTTALERCERAGLRRVAIYGAGAHTAACGMALANAPVEVAVIIDDARAGGRLWGYPIVSREQAVGMGIEGVVLSSDRAEPLLIEQSAVLMERGIAVIALYAAGEPAWLERAGATAAA